MPANLENSAVATGLEKVSFHSNPKERQCQRMLKLPHIVLMSHASKLMLKILQARLWHYVYCEPPDVQGGLEKAEEAEIKLPTSLDHLKSKRVPEKHLFLLHWLCQSL